MFPKTSEAKPKLSTNFCRRSVSFQKKSPAAGATVKSDELLQPGFPGGSEQIEAVASCSHTFSL